jgi:hypothetical protein
MATIAKSPTVLLPSVTMSQSALMMGALFAGFIIWLTLKGKLGTYWALMTGGTASGGSPPIGPTVGSTNPDGSTTIIPPLIPFLPNSGLTFKWTNPFGPGGLFGPPATPPPATTTTPPAATGGH